MISEKKKWHSTDHKAQQEKSRKSAIARRAQEMPKVTMPAAPWETQEQPENDE